MTLTIEVPDEVAAQLEGLTQEERERYALDALVFRLSEWTPEEASHDHAEIIVAVEETLDDMDADQAARRAHGPYQPQCQAEQLTDSIS